MPNVNGQGKPGTVTVAEFEALTSAVTTWGAKVLAQKVAKICSKKASMLSHEFSSSAIAAAYTGVASRITTGLGGGFASRPVSSEFFSTLTNMVATYGPEVVIQKLAKIAGRSGASADKTLLGGWFPKSGSGSAPVGAARPAAAARNHARLGY